MDWTEYIAVGFPLVTSIILAALFPINLKDYFVKGEIKQLGHGLTPYKFRAIHYLYIFAAYITSAALLGLAQDFLLWDVARTPGMRYVLRYTDYFLYPIFPSGVMAVFLMLFFFSSLYVRRGEDDVRKFLLRTYEGWQLYKDIPRFRPVVLAAGILCTAANLWIYNIYIGVTDKAIIYHTPYSMKPETVEFDDIAFFIIRKNQSGAGGKGNEGYTLRIVTKGLDTVITKDSLLQSRNDLLNINTILEEYGEASGKYTDVVLVNGGVDSRQVVWGTLADRKK
jgi:hypothetical protein